MNDSSTEARSGCYVNSETTKDPKSLLRWFYHRDRIAATGENINPIKNSVPPCSQWLKTAKLTPITPFSCFSCFS